MQEKVIIIGGGIGGLTAAHELIDRGFQVHLFERRDNCGGKASSSRSPVADGLKDLPREHGFRFFPGWYRHLPDTMKRIPYLGRHKYYEGASVYDNLITVESNLLTWTNRDPLPLPLRPPRNLSDAAAIGELLSGLGALGLTAQEVALFARKLLAIVAMSDEERLAQLESITWWQYLECDQPGKSDAYRDLVQSSIRTSIAAKATEVSAYTVGRLAIRSLIDTLNTVDRVLNGPTSEVWIQPWVEHLKERGVHFYFGEELDSITVGRGTNNIQQVTIVPFWVSELRRLRRQLTSIVQQCYAIAFEPQPGPGAGEDAIWTQRLGQLKDDVDSAKPLVWRFRESKDPGNNGPAQGSEGSNDEPFDDLDQTLRKALATLGGEGRRAADRSARTEANAELKDVIRNLIKNVPSKELAEALQALSDLLASVLTTVRAHESPPEGLADSLTYAAEVLNGLGQGLVAEETRVLTNPNREPLGKGDYYVFALPLEQMAYYINRSPMMVTLDPDLQGIVDLTAYLEWMAGIQFYLSEPFDFAPGHIVGVDSEWGLTALEQTHFWRDIKLPEGVKAVLSVDISAWDKQGRFVRKEAFNCANDEIASEVWQQLKSLLDRKRKSSVLRDEMLLGNQQNQLNAAKFRSTGPKPNYHLDGSIVDLQDRKKQALYEKARSVKYSEMNAKPDVMSYVWGPRRLRFNLEPLLINRVGSRRFRPEARTGIRNMFLAADYVRTDTDLACMEGANEAGRRAVNAILDVTGSTEERCKLWPFSVSRDLSTSLLLARGGSATSAIGAARSAALGIKNKVIRALNPEIAGRRLFPWPTDGADGE
jgi:uncharacterized protein with NAD-binding domain and iron-sulfur cluster